MLRASGCGGVSHYTVGIARFAVPFPAGKEDCRHCPFCLHREAYNVFVCRLTDEYIEKEMLGERHRLCPVEFELTENE